MTTAASRPLERRLDPDIEPIREKVLAGERLSAEDGVRLFRTRDVFTLGELANHVRERLHGRNAYYNINRHINYTNFCVLRCKFCSFYRPFSRGKEVPSQPAPAAGERDPRVVGPFERGPGYEMGLEEIVDVAAAAHADGATEVHIVGGLHPSLPFSFYLDMCRAIRSRCPGLHIKAFTAIEIVHFTRISRPRLSVSEVLSQLREAGLNSLPGGGAEIFDDRVHDEAFKNKVGEKHWFDVHRAAHDLGIPSNATMLYGHIESVEERVTHLVKLREHQDESLARIQRWDSAQAAGPTPDGPRPGAFQTLIPLSFIPDGSEFGALPGPTGLDDLRTLAVSRLMLDNFPHIKAFWIMQSPKLSQVALNWGVDDFDGTVVWYDITKREGRGSNHQELHVDQIQALMREAGCVPVERDSIYRPVHRVLPG